MKSCMIYPCKHLCLIKNICYSFCKVISLLMLSLLMWGQDQPVNHHTNPIINNGKRIHSYLFCFFLEEKMMTNFNSYWLRWYKDIFFSYLSVCRWNVIRNTVCSTHAPLSASPETPQTLCKFISNCPGCGEVAQISNMSLWSYIFDIDIFLFSSWTVEIHLPCDAMIEISPSFISFTFPCSEISKLDAQDLFETLGYLKGLDER